MLRFAILLHDHPALHWDFFLEAGEGLRSWRLAESPAAGREIEATPLPEHRIHYLDYEGPVSGGRGTVARVARGTYHVIQETATTLEIILEVHESVDCPTGRLVGRFEQNDVKSTTGCRWSFVAADDAAAPRSC